MTPSELERAASVFSLNEVTATNNQCRGGVHLGHGGGGGGLSLLENLHLLDSMPHIKPLEADTDQRYKDSTQSEHDQVMEAETPRVCPLTSCSVTGRMSPSSAKTTSSCRYNKNFAFVSTPWRRRPTLETPASPGYWNSCCGSTSSCEVSTSWTSAGRSCSEYPGLRRASVIESARTVNHVGADMTSCNDVYPSRRVLPHLQEETRLDTRSPTSPSNEGVDAYHGYTRSTSPLSPHYITLTSKSACNNDVIPPGTTSVSAGDDVKRQLNNVIKRRRRSLGLDLFLEEVKIDPDLINQFTPRDEERRHKRREQNKMAAQRCRQRKREATITLVREYQQLECSNTDLRHQIRLLEKEKDELKNNFQEHLASCNKKADDGTSGENIENQRLASRTPSETQGSRSCDSLKRACKISKALA